jgi:hypothetical protein
MFLVPLNNMGMRWFNGEFAGHLTQLQGDSLAVRRVIRRLVKKVLPHIFSQNIFIQNGWNSVTL